MSHRWIPLVLAAALALVCSACQQARGTCCPCPRMAPSAWVPPRNVDVGPTSTPAPVPTPDHVEPRPGEPSPMVLPEPPPVDSPPAASPPAVSPPAVSPPDGDVPPAVAEDEAPPTSQPVKREKALVVVHLHSDGRFVARYPGAAGEVFAEGALLVGERGSTEAALERLKAGLAALAADPKMRERDGASALHLEIHGAKGIKWHHVQWIMQQCAVLDPPVYRMRFVQVKPLDTNAPR